MMKTIEFPRIVHIITDLNGFGGTEATLMRYLNNSRFPKECHKIIALKSIGTGDVLGSQIQKAGFKTVELNMKMGGAIRGCLTLFREIRNFNPNLLSAWLYHPSLLASVIAPFISPSPKVVWHIRSLTFSSLFGTPSRYLVQRALALISKIANPLVISNSEEALRQHRDIGFSFHSEQLNVVSNGIDLGEYYPDKADCDLFRKELGIPCGSIVIGCVGRFVPEKGYAVFFEAIDIVKSILPTDLFDNIYFICAGQGVTSNNPAFSRLLTKSISPYKTHLLGRRPDVKRILRSLDIFVLPSISEAFPNALIEAMATGLPCIATDVGESAEALGNVEYLAEPNNPNQLAELIIKCISLDISSRQMLGNEYRERVMSNYSLDRMVISFDNLFQGAR